MPVSLLPAHAGIYLNQMRRQNNRVMMQLFIRHNRVGQAMAAQAFGTRFNSLQTGCGLSSPRAPPSNSKSF